MVHCSGYNAFNNHFVLNNNNNNNNKNNNERMYNDSFNVKIING
jgi:hypothetical protein